MHSGGLNQVTGGRAGAVVVAHGLHEHLGQGPGGQEGPAQLGVVEAEDLAFGLGQQGRTLVAQVQRPRHALGVAQVEYQAPEIVEQAAEVELFHVGLAAHGGDHAGRRGAGQAVAPERLHAGRGQGEAAEGTDHGGGQQQVAHLARSDYRQGRLDAVDLAREAVEARVGDAKQLGAEGAVASDHRRHILQRGGRVPDQAFQLQIHLGQGGQARGLADQLLQGLSHAFPP